MLWRNFRTYIMDSFYEITNYKESLYRGSAILSDFPVPNNFIKKIIDA